MAPERKFLIVNADDFGLSEPVNVGILKAHREGIVTSASLMIHGAAAGSAADVVAANPLLSVGLHVDLGEWVLDGDQWVQIRTVAKLTSAQDVRDEIDRQFEAFKRLLGREPSHIDSHQHAHRGEPSRSLLLQRSRELGIPLRTLESTIGHYGGFYGMTNDGQANFDAISVESLLKFVAVVRPGVTEMACHPGFAGSNSVYDVEREHELRTLCDPRVRQAIDAAGIQLCSFAGWSSRR